MQNLTPTGILGSAINISLDTASMSSLKSSADRAEYLEACLIQYFNEQAMHANGTTQSTPSIYPIATKGVLAEHQDPTTLPANISQYQTGSQSQTLQIFAEPPHGFKKIIYASLIGLLFPVVFLIGLQMAIGAIGWTLVLIMYPFILAAAILYTWLLTKLLRVINCNGAWLVSIVSAASLIGIHFGLLSKMHGPFAGISDTIWRIIAITIGNALVVGILVAISEDRTPNTVA